MNNYYIVTVRWEKDAEQHIFVVAPGLRLFKETRSVNQIVESAAKKYDISFTNSCYGYSHQFGEEVNKAICKELSKIYGENVKRQDCDIDICNKIVTR